MSKLHVESGASSDVMSFLAKRSKVTSQLYIQVRFGFHLLPLPLHLHSLLPPQYYMNFLITLRTLRPTTRFFHTPTLTRTFKPQLLRYQPSPLSYATASNMETNNKDLELSNLFDVKGKVALVTGGGSGIGLMCAQALAVNGAKVYIVGRTEEKLERVVEAHGKGIAGEIIPLVADITSKDEIRKLVKEIESREPYLSVLINNAGINTSTQKPEGETGTELKKNLFDPENANFDDWATTYKTNVPQLYFMTLAFLPLLEKATEHQKGFTGTAINITSISGLVLKSQAHFSYNASKAAAIQVTKLLASEIANAGVKVRVNSIAPGVFPSEMTAKESKDNQKSEIPAEKYAHLPARRPGNDRDMANAVLFMVTNQYLNGQIVPVDGGYLLKFGS